MITPDNRLIFWTGALLPLLLLPASMPGVWIIFVVLLVFLAAAAAADAVMARKLLKGLDVSLPEIIRVSKNQDGVIPITVRTSNDREVALELGLPVPDSLESEHDTLDANIPAGPGDFAVSWNCRAAARGSFPIDMCCLRVSSPLRFWKCRGERKCSTEVRVYPNMLPERRRLSSIFLNRSAAGIHSQRMVGQGRDFEKLREYINGDSYDDVHWKATAKRGRPITKIFQVERTQEIYVIIDSSRLSGRQAGAETLIEKYISSALVMGMVAERQGDLFGLVTFDSRVRKFLRASGGKAHFNACRDAIYTMNASLVSPDYDELATFLRLRLRKRALLLILTDLSDPMLAESFARHIDILKRQHVILVQSILPEGIGPMFSTPSLESSDELYEKLSGHILWRSILSTKKALQRKGVSLATVDSEKLCAEMVNQYMSVKARQAL